MDTRTIAARERDGEREKGMKVCSERVWGRGAGVTREWLAVGVVFAVRIDIMVLSESLEGARER